MAQDILLFGLGAVGAVYAYILSLAPDTRVTVCARSNFAIVKDKGLDFKSERYGNQHGYKFHNAVRDPADCASTNFAFVVCTNKAIAMKPSASEQIAPSVSENTTIVLIQNGVGNDEEFRARFPRNTILSGVTWVKANQPQPGTIIHGGTEMMQFGCHWSDEIDREVQQRHLDSFVETLLAGGTQVDVVPSIELWRWKKTIWNCAWNTLTALTQCNTAEYLAASSSGVIVARRIIDEMALIAKTLGHDVDSAYLASLIDRPQIKAGIYSSMCADAIAGRPMEVDAIVAGPLRKAKELGLYTPTLETINALVSALDWRFQNGVIPRL